MDKRRNYFVKTVKDIGVEAGLAYDVDTEIGEIPKEVDMILLLSRKAGFEPYLFDEKIFKKIIKLNEIRQEKGLNFVIGVDGGINEKNIGQLNSAGVEVACCGGAIFNGIVEDNIKKLEYASKNK